MAGATRAWCGRGLAALAATVLLWAARVPEGPEWSQGLEPTLAASRAREVPAFLLFTRPDRPLGLAMRRQWIEAPELRSRLAGFACGEVDARDQREWLRSELGVPAALALVVLGLDGRVQGAHVGYAAVEQVEQLLLCSKTLQAVSADGISARAAAAADLGRRGLGHRAAHLLDGLLLEASTDDQRAAVLEARLRLSLGRGEVRRAARDLEALEPLASALPDGHLSHDRAWLAFARREVGLGLELLPEGPSRAELPAVELLRARMLHELERDQEALVCLDALERLDLTPSHRSAARAVRRHVTDSSLDHSHGPR